MGYFVSAVAIFIVSMIAQVVIVVLVGAAGAFILPAAFLGKLVVEMFNQIRKGEIVVAYAVCISGLAILLPVTWTLFAYPSIPSPFFLADLAVGSGLDPAVFSEAQAVVILLFTLMWLLGGGYLTSSAFNMLVNHNASMDASHFYGYTLFITVWGLTVSPIIGWMFGGLSELAMSGF